MKGKDGVIETKEKTRREGQEEREYKEGREKFGVLEREGEKEKGKG